jgi:putative hydrolase of HD superfamily
MNRLQQQIQFVFEIDKLKHVFRQTLLMDKSRYENDAEHSWHLAMMAMLLHGYSPEDVDVLRVIKMVLIHDLVEIDAGDTFCYDDEGRRDQAEREQRAADRIFPLLPADQATELREFWEEFERRESADARFACALDRLQPLLHNIFTKGAAWQQHGIRRSQVLARNRIIADGAPALWEYVSEMIDDAVAKGYLADG